MEIKSRLDLTEIFCDVDDFYQSIEYMKEVCQGVAKKMGFKLIQLNGESDYS